jgi:phage nucleotide-binding protein
VEQVKMVVYGAPGAGKTVFLGSAVADERTWPALFLNFEGGTMSIASKCNHVKVNELGKPKQGTIDVIKPKNMDEFDKILEFLEGDHPYKCVLIDSLTEINYLNLMEATEHNPKSTGIPQIGDYGTNAVQMRRMIRAFRDLEAHIIIACLAQESKDDMTGKVTIKPSLTGKLSDEVPAMVDIVGYLTVDTKDNARVMFFQPTAKAIAKDRSEGGKLGDCVENATLPTVLDYLEGKVEHETVEAEVTE